jgi:hypothetical protein
VTDYLTGIVARTIGGAETAQPRVPSMFEPSPVGDTTAAVMASPAARAEPDAVPRRRELEARADQLDRPARGRQTDVALSANQRDRRRPATRAAVDEPVAGSPPTASLQPAAPVEPLSVTSRPTAKAQPSPPEPTDALTSPEAAEPGSHPARRSVGRSAAAVESPKVQPRPRATSEAAGAERRATAPPPSDRGRARPTDGRPPAEAPSVRPRIVDPRGVFAEAQASARRLARTSGQTLVHVSIGRVDVRAVGEPSQPERARDRPKPPTALDDYLGRRNGTRR